MEGCVPVPPPLKKHRTQLIVSRSFFLVLSLVQMVIALNLVFIKGCSLGFHIIGVVIFGLILLRSVPNKYAIVWSYQVLVLYLTAHTFYSCRIQQDGEKIKDDFANKAPSEREPGLQELPGHRFNGRHPFRKPPPASHDRQGIVTKRPGSRSYDTESALARPAADNPDSRSKAEGAEPAVVPRPRTRPLGERDRLLGGEKRGRRGDPPQPPQVEVQVVRDAEGRVKYHQTRLEGARGGGPRGIPDLDPSLPFGFRGDLEDPSEEEVRLAHPQLVRGDPAFTNGTRRDWFDTEHKNPCFTSKAYGSRQARLECLPYAYIIGMPKSGSSDLWERLTKHHLVLQADRKEVRFFTRGEFDAAPPSDQGFLPPGLRLEDFTRHHTSAADAIAREGDLLPGAGKGKDGGDGFVIVDGGPHTLWWSIQNPDGSAPLAPPPTRVEDNMDMEKGAPPAPRPPAPIPLLLHAMQPRAKLLVTLADPVRRMYSDYYFLHANGVARTVADKSPAAFDEIARSQVGDLRRCLMEQTAAVYAEDGSAPPLVSPPESGTLDWWKDLEREPPYVETPEALPLRAEQACAYDRYHFGRPGTGRISVGLYHAFLARWLGPGLFARDQMLILRLEDFNDDPKEYLSRAFRFLGLRDPDDYRDFDPVVTGGRRHGRSDARGWEDILVSRTFNEHQQDRPPIDSATEALLRRFYGPFNHRLANFLRKERPKSALALEVESPPERFEWADIWKASPSATEGVFSHWSAGRDSTSRELPLSAADLHHPNGAARFSDRDAILSSGEHDPREESLEDRGPPRGRRPKKDPGGREGLIAIKEEVVTRDDGATAICLASLGLYPAALERILKMPGVSASSVMVNDKRRSGLHCLGSIFTFADSLRNSYLFALLQNTSHWLDDILEPPPIRNRASYGLPHLTKGVGSVVADIATILLNAGADPNAADDGEKTPLHYAALGGLESLASALLRQGADPDRREQQHGRTPLHFCATHGHAGTAKLLLDAGADPLIKDAYGYTFKDVATAVGTAIAPSVLSKTLAMAKTERKVLPLSTSSLMEKKHGTGGWSEQSLPPRYSHTKSWGKTNPVELDEREDGEAKDSYCALDMLDGTTVTSTQVFDEYIMMNRPVLIRGLNTDSPAWDAYSRATLSKSHRNLKVHVSDIPYNVKFGSLNGKESSLGDYIQAMSNHSLEGGDHPWYVFKGHPVPRRSSAEDSLVPTTTVPIPRLMYDIFATWREHITDDKVLAREKGNDPEAIDEQEKRRKDMVNMQWALGTAGSGAPVHFHNTAWNQLFYGRKHWYLFPPGQNIMGKKQVLDWLENDMTELMDTGFEAMECIQRQGDILIVPELWGHAVLNTQDSIAVASELKKSNFRIPLPRAFQDLSPNARKGPPPGNV